MYLYSHSNMIATITYTIILGLIYLGRKVLTQKG